MDADAGMQLVRESIEGFLEPRAASAVIFEAVGARRGAALPSDLASLLEFVRGPLRDAVVERAGVTVAAEVVERVEQVLGRVGSVTPATFGLPDTLRLPPSEGPVRVLVLSANPSLGLALRAALGPESLGVARAQTLDDARLLAERLAPELLIVDAAAPAFVEAADLVPVLGQLDGATPVLLWGAELPVGAALSRALDEAGSRHVPVDRQEGVLPLLDYVRSRRDAG